MLSSVDILGLRGFADQQSVRLSLPNDKPGSGLTVIVGANNSGKSTIIEAFRALAQPVTGQPPSFTQGRRNRMAGDRVYLCARGEDGSEVRLSSVHPGGSETVWRVTGNCSNTGRIMVVPSRRAFNPYFGRGEWNRNTYINNSGFPAIRETSLDSFSMRLFTIQKHVEAFNSVLAKVLSPVPDWAIDQTDTGQYYVKFMVGDSTHSSEGLGEGLISLFFMVDALYDSQRGDVIVIDEPELSLHPSLQRRLATLLAEYARDRQIVVSTHSPLFVKMDALSNGATVARVHLAGSGKSRISQTGQHTAHAVSKLLADANNPHIFGVNAQEVFFEEDQIILVEGQEDVVFYDRVQESLGIRLAGSFFGWGVGGVGNMSLVARILSELGFAKVAGILDGNCKEIVADLEREFPSYYFCAIPADDIRTKPAVDKKDPVEGLLNKQNRSVRSEYVDETRELFTSINRYLNGTPEG